jgi:hypothetical protein
MKGDTQLGSQVISYLPIYYTTEGKSFKNIQLS